MNVHTNYKRPLSRFYNRCWSNIKKWKNITICIWSNCSIIKALVQKSIIVKSAIWTQPWGSRSMEEVDLVEKIQTVTVCFNKYHLSTSCLIFYGHSHITPKPPSRSKWLANQIPSVLNSEMQSVQFPSCTTRIPVVSLSPPPTTLNSYSKSYSYSKEWDAVWPTTINFLYSGHCKDSS